MNSSIKSAAKLHEKVPPDWYYRSIKRNLLQRIWHKKRFSVISSLSEKSDRVLDIGCADGVFTNEIAKSTHAREVVGIDVLKDSVSWARRKWRGKNMKFLVGNAHKLNFRANYFDAVYALEVMEHVSNPDKVISEIKRVLKRDGCVIILVPTDNTLFRIIWFFLTKFWWARIWNDCHIQSFSKKNSLSRHLKDAGFEIEIDKTFWLGMLNVVKARKK